MNRDCEIVQDLLPLYVDGICSHSSAELVETHVRDCEIYRCLRGYGYPHLEKNSQAPRSEYYAPAYRFHDAWSWRYHSLRIDTVLPRSWYSSALCGMGYDDFLVHQPCDDGILSQSLDSRRYSYRYRSSCLQLRWRRSA